MRLTRVRIPEHATPVLALVCDGALYDVGALEEHWSLPPGELDFHARVVAARAAGLEALHERLLSGRRPSAARILPGTYLPLPPCDPARAAYVQLGPAEASGPEPRLRLRDARALVGDAQPVPVWGDAELHAEIGLAAVLGDDLEDATPAEARRALLGVTLVVDWTLGDPWGAVAPQPGANLGPHLVLAPRLADLQRGGLRWATDEAGSGETGPLERRHFAVEEALAFASRRVRLRAGDVVGLGHPPGGRIPLRVGSRLRVELPGALALVAWTLPAPERSPWRLPGS